tara:strand:+ start:486 stop:698 length:213 start_codon:yes stop_codon:yes gene_type:complete
MSLGRFFQQGLPTIGFLLIGTYSLTVFQEGKNKSLELSRGKSKSERQAEIDIEHEKILAKVWQIYKFNLI